MKPKTKRTECVAPVRVQPVCSADRFVDDPESGYIYDKEKREWLTEADEVFDAMWPLITQLESERRMLAMLSADTPQFYNPFDAIEAKHLRDQVLNLPNDQAHPTAADKKN